ncbi:hypothetical protein [Saccharolobus shibatae]|uniref:Uncharacterized protein n=1 Tax=Saccharolobus shibatae TaxID=2286 RepID=A0A8F5BYQ5_9CREN|nr:hypothetical protein [Saccharolobus shibatae]QXJ33821.1 hypothetical protein J5U22_00366 [Saccharolobus shibatae]
MESEIRKLLDKAEKLVDKCVECGNSDCEECDDARELLNEIREKIDHLEDRKVARRLSTLLYGLEVKLEDLE